MRPANPNYRPDIDGLRAIAVLMVLACHLETSYLIGGFVGVDIFFVISGYLISKILLKELEQGRFSIAAFYVRRVRRIAPALIALLAATSLAAYFMLLPSELKAFSWSVIATIFSASNFYFGSQSGYFEALASSKPLLHTWSLAVEEQFYLFFPLLLAFVFRRKRDWVKPSLIIFATTSFLFSLWAVKFFPTIAFYWPLSRIWELMCGTCLAVGLVPAIRSATGRNAASLLGLGLIVYAGQYYRVSTPFPGFTALAPCIGTALIIAAGTHGTSLVNRVLSWRPIVFIGLISYSLYLWHWPIIVFSNIGLSVDGLSPHVRKIFLAIVSIVVGTLSWWLIERPFRSGAKGIANSKIFLTAALCAAVPAVIAVVFLARDGVKSRFPPSAIAVASYLENPSRGDKWHYRIGSCFIPSSNSYGEFDRSTCLTPDTALPNYLILGDSHAAHLYYGLSVVFPQDHILQATASGCRPLLEQPDEARKDCVEIVEFVLKDYLPKSHLKAVLMGGSWSPDELDALGRTLAYIKGLGVQPIVFGPAVQYDLPLPRLLAKSIRNSDPTLPERHQVPEARKLDGRMANLAKTVWHVPYISYFDTLCKGSACMVYASPEVPMEGDIAHFTAPGSVAFAQRLKAAHALD
jgi:peptidoglycan/LPS O-acetylase OafA/YrhL